MNIVHLLHEDVDLESSCRNVLIKVFSVFPLQFVWLELLHLAGICFFGASVNSISDISLWHPHRPRWFSGRVSAWGMEGCGFDPQPRHTKRRSKMVQVARHWKVSAWKYGWSARCQLIMWLGGLLLSSACDRSAPVWQQSNLSHAGTVAIWLK